MGRSFVQQNADGSFSTVWQDDAGNFEEIYRGDQAHAEDNVNVLVQTRGGGSTNTTSDTGGITAEHRDGLRRAGYGDWNNPNLTEADFARISAGAQKGGGTSGIGGLLNSLYGSNQQYFDFDKQKWGEDLAFRKEQMAGEQAAQERALYSNLAQGLLSSATALGSRPGDWLSYANSINGGRNIFNSLYGDKATPTFGAPSGFTEPGNIQDVLMRLGLIPGGGQNGTQGTSGTQTAMQKATAPITGEPVRENAPQQSTGNPLIDALRARMGQGGDQMTGIPVGGPGDDYGGGDYHLWPGVSGQDGGYSRLSSSGVGGVSQTGTDVMSPNPHQINPMVWDSLSRTAKEMILGAAGAGKTPSGSWNPEDFLNQLNASRPQGTAPRRVQTSFASPSSMY